MRRNRRPGRFPQAVLASVVLHAAVIAAGVVSMSRAEIPPRVRTIGVSIVSPPPNLAGPPPATAPCLLYTSPSPRDLSTSRMPSSA